MDLNNLNKHQVILVALLVSFVASTATGIITVSLMNQAPPPVTQTIEHVIQTTVEKVAPSANGAAVAQETVIVSEDNATIAAIAKASASIVRIYSFDPTGASRFAGFGVIATSSASATTAYVVGRAFTIGQTSFTGHLDGGNTVNLFLISTDPLSGLSIFSLSQGSNLAEAKAFTGATFTNSDGVQLGQTVVAIGGNTNPFISTGIISSLSSITPSATSSVETVTNIRANISDQDLLTDAVLVDLSGNIVGFKTGSSVAEGFIPAKYAVNLVNQEP